MFPREHRAVFYFGLFLLFYSSESFQDSAIKEICKRTCRVDDRNPHQERQAETQGAFLEHGHKVGSVPDGPDIWQVMDQIYHKRSISEIIDEPIGGNPDPPEQFEDRDTHENRDDVRLSERKDMLPEAFAFASCLILLQRIDEIVPVDQEDRSAKKHEGQDDAGRPDLSERIVFFDIPAEQIQEYAAQGCGQGNG